MVGKQRPLSQVLCTPSGGHGEQQQQSGQSPLCPPVHPDGLGPSCSSAPTAAPSAAAVRPALLISRRSSAIGALKDCPQAGEGRGYADQREAGASPGSGPHIQASPANARAGIHTSGGGPFRTTLGSSSTSTSVTAPRLPHQALCLHTTLL